MRGMLFSRRLLSAVGVFVAMFSLSVSPAWGQETLSAAEQAALDAQIPADQRQKLINICHHILLHGGESQKTDLLSSLGTQTCAQAIDDGLFDTPTS